MKMNFIKAISFVLCLCLLSSFCFSSVSNASSIEEIQDNNIKVICNDDDVCTVESSYENRKVSYTLDKKSSEITMQVTEKSTSKLFGIFPGKDKITNYTVEIDMLGQDYSVSAIATDIETGESFRISNDSDKVIAQWVYPLSGIFGPTLVALLKEAGRVVIVGAATWFILEYVTKHIKDTGYEYFTADIKNNIVIVGHAIPLSEARDRLLAGRNILGLRQYNAQKACNEAIKTNPNYYKLIGYEISGTGGGYFYHYHIRRDHPSHAFFLYFD